LAKRITTKLVRGRDVAGDEGVGGVHQGHALEVDVGARELRRDVVDVIRHAAQDGVDHGLGRIAALVLVAVQLLDPLQVDRRHHADQQVGVLGDMSTLSVTTAPCRPS
jgi:hypothetical protein